jgi:HEAT repeat protein
MIMLIRILILLFILMGCVFTSLIYDIPIDVSQKNTLLNFVSESKPRPRQESSDWVPLGNKPVCVIFCNRDDRNELSHESPDSGQQIQARLTEVSEIATLFEYDAIVLLFDALSDEYEEVRIEAVQALADIGTEPAAQALTAALSDKMPRVREEAVDALADIASDSAIYAIARVITDDPSLQVRHAAIEALADIGGESAAFHLLQALADRDRDVRIRAASTFSPYSL